MRGIIKTDCYLTTINATGTTTASRSIDSSCLTFEPSLKIPKWGAF